MMIEFIKPIEKLLTEYKISLNDYLCLDLVTRKQFNEYSRLIRSGILTQINKESLKRLKLTNVIEDDNIVDIRTVKLTESFKTDKNKLLIEKDYEEVDNAKKSDTRDTRWLEFLNVYPKQHNSRYLHNLKSQCKDRYYKYLKSKDNPNEEHKRVLKITEAWVRHKKHHDQMYSVTKDDKYWIEDFCLLSTYINNIEDKLEQYEDLINEEVSESNISTDINIE